MPDVPPRPEAGDLAFLPLFHDLRGRLCLLSGGGPMAAAKAALLLRAGARLRIVAPVLCTELDDAVRSNRAEHRPGPFEPADLDDTVLAIDASCDDRTARAVVDAARAHGIPANVVDRPELCDVIFPALLERGPVVVAVSTGGLAPALARLLRQRLELAIPAAFGRLARLAGTMRGRVRARLEHANARRRFWDAAFAGPPADLMLAGREADARAAFETLLDAHADGLADGVPPVRLVGAGPGDPDLLTVAAVRSIGQADVVLYDALVDPAILALARREAEMIPVGKRAGRHSMTQGRINELIARHALAGRRVVRLKGGDPLLFGRGGEEMEHLRGLGIPVRVIPGVTAALGCAASAGVPLTHRDHARSLHVVTAHCREGAADGIDWARLADPAGTLAIYMGRRHLAEAAARLIAAGLAPDTPAVAIENGTLHGERRCFAPLRDLAGHAARELGDGPTLVLVGHVVALCPEAGGPRTAVGDRELETTR